MTTPEPRAGILDIAPYVPGRAGADHDGPVHKLSSNESPLGPSPKALAAMRALDGEALTRYPDDGQALLRAALAARHGLDESRIVCGNGSDELLTLLAHGYLAPGEEAIVTEHGFLVYPIAIRAAGGRVVTAPDNADLTSSVDAILERAGPRTKLVYLANPNNPTGTYLPFEEVKRLRAGLPESCLLVIDAAYAEYVQRNDYEAGVSLVSACDNVVMTRTFSKAYGLAGLRLGWLYGPRHVVEVLDRIRGPFNINAAAVAAGLAALEDQAHLQRAVAHNAEWLPWLSERLEEIGLAVTPSVANFILIHFPDEEGRRAADAERFLDRRGLILRGMGGYGFPGALRTSIGSEEANRQLVAALREFMERG